MVFPEIVRPVALEVVMLTVPGRVVDPIVEMLIAPLPAARVRFCTPAAVALRVLENVWDWLGVVMIADPVNTTGEGKLSAEVDVVMLLPMLMSVGVVGNDNVPMLIAPVVVAVPVVLNCKVVVLSPLVGPTLIVPDPDVKLTVTEGEGVNVPVENVIPLLVVVKVAELGTLMSPPTPAV
jgi:hypothetical protein